MMDFLKTLLDPHNIIQYGGLALLLIVIFAETGIMIGFFLPGDNLILLAGILCRTHPELMGNVSLPVLLLLMILAAFLGNMTGYWFGFVSGEFLFRKEDSFFFKKSRLELTRKYYEKYGGNVTLIVGRFLPVIRTFAPIIAGAIRIPLKKFIFFNIAGAVLWISTLGLAGYFLIYFFPNLEQYLNYIFLALIILTAIPVIQIARKKKGNEK